MEHPLVYFTAVCYAALIIAFYRLSILTYRSRFKAPLRYPPGPEGVPILQNLLDVSLCTEFWRRLQDLKATYGGLVYLKVFGVPMLYVNSYELCVNLLERRSSSYSSRPRFIMPIEYSGWSFIMNIMPYNQRLKDARMVSHRLLRFGTTTKLRELLDQEARVLVRQLHVDPSNFEYHLRRFPAAVLLMATQGYQAARGVDPVVTRNYSFTLSFFGLLDDYYTLNLMPWRTKFPSWFPGGGFKLQARKASNVSRAMLDAIRERLRKSNFWDEIFSAVNLAAAADVPSSNPQTLSFAEEDVLTSLASIQNVGGDTIAATLMAFVLAMLRNPSAQRKGQEEIDSVVGRGRLPTSSDRENLPYIRAICTEVLRWDPILPLAPPRLALEDDYINDYFIPQGTQVYINIWGIMHNSKDFPEPMTFKPERWLAKSGTQIMPQPERVVFGFGRRVCVGRSFSEHAIFLAIASILSMYTVEHAEDVNGKPIPVSPSYTKGAVHRLEYFPCAFVPRDGGRMKSVLEDWDS